MINGLTKNMKSWLKELYKEAASEHLKNAKSCHIWAMGSKDNNEACKFEMDADEHRAFAHILEAMAKEI